ncbi:MAG: hypothetical protein AAF755_07515 [Pseudomonadota bacterium]
MEIEVHPEAFDILPDYAKKEVPALIKQIEQDNEVKVLALIGDGPPVWGTDPFYFSPSAASTMHYELIYARPQKWLNRRRHWVSSKNQPQFKRSIKSPDGTSYLNFFDGLLNYCVRAFKLPTVLTNHSDRPVPEEERAYNNPKWHKIIWSPQIYMAVPGFVEEMRKLFLETQSPITILDAYDNGEKIGRSFGMPPERHVFDEAGEYIGIKVDLTLLFSGVAVLLYYHMIRHSQQVLPYLPIKQLIAQDTVPSDIQENLYALHKIWEENEYPQYEIEMLTENSRQFLENELGGMNDPDGIRPNIDFFEAAKQYMNDTDRIAAVNQRCDALTKRWIERAFS